MQYWKFLKVEVLERSISYTSLGFGVLLLDHPTLTDIEDAAAIALGQPVTVRTRESAYISLADARGCLIAAMVPSREGSLQ